MRYEVRYRLFILLCISIMLFSFIASASAINTELEDMMAGVKLGAKTEELTAKFSGIYKHQLMMGEVHYEACNQQPLEVFTFTEEPWSKGYITNIWVRKAEVAVCRDSTGGLPDYSIAPATPRGVKLGDKEENVIKLYGTPTSVKSIPGGKKILTYKATTDRKDIRISNLTLHFEINSGLVIGFHLLGDMPGAKKPY